jgi:hypothetical protein
VRAGRAGHAGGRADFTLHGRQTAAGEVTGQESPTSRAVPRTDFRCLDAVPEEFAYRRLRD